MVLTVDAVKGSLIAPPAATNSKSRQWLVDAPPPAIVPFDAAQARAHQAAWADFLGVPVEYENSIGMKFRLIPPGEFLMGSTAAEIDVATPRKKSDEWQEFVRSEGPRHRVVLTRPVYMGVTEVTQRQFQKITGLNPSQFSAEGKEKDAVADLETLDFPVEQVSWDDAVAFCVKLSQPGRSSTTDGQTDASVDASETSTYRLPTEAEWEFACRAGTVTPYSNGDSDRQLASLGWFAGNADGRTHAVGELQPNPLGLFDMHGNVWEWVQDGWAPGFYETFSDVPAVDPRCSAQNDSRYITRGGYWRSNPWYCRSATRFAAAAEHHYGTGFRVVLEIDRRTAGNGKSQ